MPTESPYGSWRSPVTAASLVEQAVGLSQLAVDGADLWWVESRPSESGRQALVRLRPGHGPEDVLPPPWSVRTTVHEYGGRAFAVHDGVVYFSEFSDQRLWKLPSGSADPVPLTDEPARRWAVRYADPVVSPDGGWVVCIRERHHDGGVDNDIVAVATDSSATVVELVSGHDFFAAARLDPRGGRMAWLGWDHPDMPWDATRLYVAPLDWDRRPSVGEVAPVAGGPGESVSQPRWSPDGVLHYVSDRSGWWNLYRQDGAALAPAAAEFSGPDWVFGQSTYAFAGGALVAVRGAEVGERIGVVDGGRFRALDTDWAVFSWVVAAGDRVAAVAGSPTRYPAVVEIDPGDGSSRVLRRSRPADPDPEDVSVPEAVEFPTEGGLTAHALFYPPRNKDFRAPAGERPPLVVMSHGGPTSAAVPVLNPGVQFWTTRGIAVVDVDYGGSTGYGRAYRERLAGQWGVVDVDDCVNAAAYLARRGDVDGSRMVIRGGSAGGFTTLAALTFRDVFAAGASLYGVADLETLARDTHKFESRYLDKMVGPYPEQAAIYRRRSPVHHTDLLSCPIILFQGAEDAVVPPGQAEAMAAALRQKGLPVAYLLFEGEQHGFRRAETIMRVAEAELYFYGRVLGFTPADDLEPVAIENGAALGSPPS